MFSVVEHTRTSCRRVDRKALAPVLRVVNLLNVVVCIVVTEMSGWNGFVVTGVLAIGNAIAIVALSSGIIFGAIRCDRLA